MFIGAISIPYTFDGGYHTPLGRFSAVDVSKVGNVSAPKRSALEASRRELSLDVSFGSGTLLVVEQQSLENRPRAAVRYTPSYKIQGVVKIVFLVEKYW